MENKTLTIISCSNKKRDYACRADEMYIGPFFTKLYDLAKRIGGDIYISSAKYGLLKPDTIIEPYNFGIMSPFESQLAINGKISKATAKSLGWRRRNRRNPIVTKVFECQLQKLGITNEDYDVTYVGVSEYYIPSLEKIVLKQPYKNLTLGGKGMFNLCTTDYLWNQYDKLDTLKLGYRKQHLIK
jgi:hypothetical protein